ncbi:MAG: thioredoxin [Peptococcia bacterium]|jgi:thioredoxin 1
MANVMQLSETNFKSEVLDVEEPVLVDFWAPWCAPCKMLAPMIEELGEEYQGKAKICMLNVEENEAMANEFGIMNMPTMIVFKDGQEVNRLVGIATKANIARVLDETIAAQSTRN